MSETPAEPQVEEAAPKKKSKLPLIMALVLILGGGGFFYMKMKGPANKPEIKLSKEKGVELKEFLVNLKDKGVYCRTEITLGLAEGVDAKSLEEKEAPIRDAINMRIASKALSDVDNLAGLKQLKCELAADLNKILDDKKSESDKPPAEGDQKVADKPAGKPGDKSADKKDPKKNAEADAPKHPDWDSETGPVLKIYFTSFATQ